MSKSANQEKAVKETNSKRAPAPSSGYFEAPDGAPLWFEDTGGEGPVLFYIYGLACSIQHWKYPKEHFSTPSKGSLRRRNVYLDFRGHGRSPTPRKGGRVTINQLVSDIVALCDYRGIEGATFLGQSLGGTIALSLAGARPDLVQGLVLLASPGRNPGPFFALQPMSNLLWKSLISINRVSPTAVRLIHAATVEAVRSPVARIPFRELVRRAGFNPSLAKTQDIEEYIDSVFDTSPNVFFDLASDLASFDFSRMEADITCPTLLISGGKDLVIPMSEQRWLAENVPHAQVAELSYGSHCPHFDDPSQVINIIDQFFKDHGL
jgi:pimeloyl-ACP methyl ester carboxylesterase